MKQIATDYTNRLIWDIHGFDMVDGVVENIGVFDVSRIEIITFSDVNIGDMKNFGNHVI
tara:strand:- start:66 stop:242 length:177 start_codon:yes stop_codon:yes gene_type:complete